MPKISKGNKEKLIKRLTKQEEAPSIEDVVDVIPHEEEDFSFLDPVDIEEEEPQEETLTEEVLAMFFQEGYDAYLRGEEITACPVDRFLEESVENQQIVQSVWEEGWVSCLRDFNTARVVLDAKALVSLLSEEVNDDTAELYDSIFEDLALAVEALDEVTDYDALEEFWQKATA